MNTLTHIAIIPDGNRRLAQRLMESPWKGHEWGVEKLYTVLGWCKEAGISTVTFYALSLENLEKRPKDELDFLFLLARRELDKILTEKSHSVHRNKTKVTFFGQLDLLPKDIQEKARQVTEMTSHYQGTAVQVAMAYGGRQEILSAANRIARRVQAGELSEVTEQDFRQALQTNGAADPDLIIRTGGEYRLSNFLTFQSVYAELAFIPTFWPELSKEEFLAAVTSYKNRNRRFGK